jgi:hypothetical protein
VTFDGKTLTCVVCGGNRFDARDSILNSRGSELFGLGWTDEKATNFACTRCGYIFWFRF